VPTTDRSQGIADPVSKLQVDTLDANCDAYGITQFKMNDKRQGIVHVIGPEQGATLPGMTVVCGDSHTSTHGAFGALAHGIGTSEVEHVLATQTLLAKKAKNMLVKVEGKLPPASPPRTSCWPSSARSAPPAAPATPSSSPARPSAPEHGRPHDGLQHGHRGGRAPAWWPWTTPPSLRQGPPVRAQGVEWEQAVAYWRTLHSDAGAHFDKVVELTPPQIRPQVTWGTSPEMVRQHRGPRARSRQGKDPSSATPWSAR
jgi:3-isopropylmalate/(R)-2-methylmalate dehydratase large subunit